MNFMKTFCILFVCLFCFNGLMLNSSSAKELFKKKSMLGCYLPLCVYVFMFMILLYLCNFFICLLK